MKPFDDPEASRKLPADVLAYVAEVEARHAKANPGPIDVHRYDNDGGSIAYQLQQSGRGEDSVVLCAFDDDDNPKARHDAEFAAKAWTDVPALIAIVREQASERDDRVADLLELSNRLGDVQRDNMALRERLAKLETACGSFVSALDEYDADPEHALGEMRYQLAKTNELKLRVLLSEKVDP